MFRRRTYKVDVLRKRTIKFPPSINHRIKKTDPLPYGSVFFWRRIPAAQAVLSIRTMIRHHFLRGLSWSQTGLKMNGYWLSTEAVKMHFMRWAKEQEL